MNGSGSISTADALARCEARLGPLAPLLRFGGVGAVNAAVGFGLYAALVALGLNLFVAQIGAQLLGMAWNYLSYGQAVFRGQAASPWRYLAAYGVNYLISLALLAGFHHLGLSPYLAGLATLLGASLLNFLILQRFVFRPRAS